MKTYADTNFFSRLYLRLPDSEEAFALLEKVKDAPGAPLPITWLHRLDHLLKGREARS